METWFYRLEGGRAEEALPALLEKTLAKGWRALVCAGDPSGVDAADQLLWTYRDDSFLPHGRAGAPYADRQPILVTDGVANQNGAEAVFVLGAAAAPDADPPIARRSFLFSAEDGPAVARARALWKEEKAADRTPAFWRRGADGRWAKAG